MRHRFVALLLLTVFLGAGTTLPSPDALLHHWSGEANNLRSHLEPAGGCASHAEQCTLGRSATGAGAGFTEAPPFRSGPAGPTSAAISPSLKIAAADRGILPQPRAPPAPAV